MSDYTFTRLLLLLFTVGELYAECTFSLNQHVPKTPLLINITSTREQLTLAYPQKINTLTVVAGARMKLSCGDKHFSKKFRKFTDLLIRCNKNDMVNANSQRVRFRELECQDFPSSSVKKNNHRRCHKNSTLYEIGFPVGKHFLKAIHICFDEQEQNSIYTWYNSSMLQSGHQSKVPRPYFVHDNLYRFPVDDVYKSTYQREWFAKLLKSKELAAKYIKDDGAHFLSRGHLTPKADFVYGVEQSATFHYINVAPQWQIFNGGNWNHVEMSVRDEIQKKYKRYIFLQYFLVTFAPRKMR